MPKTTDMQAVSRRPYHSPALTPTITQNGEFESESDPEQANSLAGTDSGNAESRTGNLAVCEADRRAGSDAVAEPTEMSSE